MQKQKQKQKKAPRMSRFCVWLSTFIFCMLFWMLLTWSLDRHEILWGLGVSAVVAAFSGRFLIHSSPFYLFNPVRLIFLGVYSVWILLGEIIKANWAMAKLVLHPEFRNYRSGIIRIPASPDVQSDYGMAWVSNSITLTPGTITLDVAEDDKGNNYYYVHWMDVTETDREKAGEIIKGRMERWIGRVWQ